MDKIDAGKLMDFNFHMKWLCYELTFRHQSETTVC